MGGDLDVDGTGKIGSDHGSSSNITGALVVGGGLGLGKNLNMGGNLDVDGRCKNWFVIGIRWTVKRF